MEKFLLKESIFSFFQKYLLCEAYFINNFEKMQFNFISLKSSRPDIKKDKKLVYKFTMTWSFVYSKSPDEITLKELKQKTLNNCIKTQKFTKLLKEHIYNMALYFNKLNNEDKYFEIEVKPNTFRKLHYNEYQKAYYAEIDFDLIFDLPEWFVDSIIRADTKKSFFFKNYKIKYRWDLNYFIRRKTDNWKDICIEAIRYAIFNKPRLKKYIEFLTKLTIDPSKVDFEISLNATQNTIKLIVVRGIIKWLKKFGIPAKWSKYILAGLTIWGILKLMEKDKDENFEKAKKTFKSFIS